MAAVPGFPVNLSIRYVPRDRVRLAVAITVSAIVHFGLAGGVTLSMTGPAPTRGQAVITAQLEIQVTQLAEPSPLPDEATVAPERVPDSPTRTRPTDDGARETASQPPLSTAPVNVMTEPASALPPLSDPEYYPARQLDVYPALVQPVSLEYANGSIGGRVQLMLLIDETGGVREFSIVEPGAARFIEDSVRSAFSEARFSPARKNGRAVKSRVLISVDYRPGVAESGP